jgi:Family of unknown function (DUF6221)
MELAEFFKGRLAEDEATAKKASSGHPAPESRAGRWQFVGNRALRYDNGAGETVAAVDTTGATCMWYEQIRVTGDPDHGVTAHIIRWDPARVLREVEAGRQLLARWHEHDARRSDNAEDEARAWLLVGLLADRATVYSDHPDYKAEWATGAGTTPAGTAAPG